MGDFVRLYYDDGTFVTLPINETTTAGQICETIQKKRGLINQSNNQTNNQSINQTNNLKSDVKKVNLSDTSSITPSSSTRNLSFTELDDNIHSVYEYDAQSNNQSTSDDSLTVSANRSNSSIANSPSRTLTAPVSTDYSLYVVDTQMQEADRRLDDEERLIDCLIDWRSAGMSGRYRLTFRLYEEIDSEDESDDSDLDAFTLDRVTLDRWRQGQAINQSINPTILKNALFAGYLDQRLSGTAWRQRFAVLIDDKLLMYKSHQSNQSMNQINLADTIISPLKLYSALSLSHSSASQPNNQSNNHATNHHTMKQSNVFEIVTPAKIFYLRTPSTFSLTQWIEQLRAHSLIEQENQVINEIQLALDETSLASCETDDIRQQRWIDSLVDCLSDEHAVAWLCYIAMDNQCVEALLAWMDIQVWFYMQRRCVGTEKLRKLSVTGPLSSGNTPTNSSPNTPRHGTGFLSRKASLTQPINQNSFSPPHPVIQRMRSRRYSIVSPTATSNTLPSSYLPSLNTSAIFDRYIEQGCEMDVKVTQSIRETLRAIIHCHESGETIDQSIIDRFNDSPSNTNTSPLTPQRQFSFNQAVHSIKELELACMDAVSLHCIDSIGRTLHDTFIHSRYLQLALIGLPVRGGTFFTHHPYRFVLNELRTERAEQERSIKLAEQAAASERSEVERRRAQLSKQRRTVTVAPVSDLHVAVDEEQSEDDEELREIRRVQQEKKAMLNKVTVHLA